MWLKIQDTHTLLFYYLGNIRTTCHNKTLLGLDKIKKQKSRKKIFMKD